VVLHRSRSRTSRKRKSAKRGSWSLNKSSSTLALQLAWPLVVRLFCFRLKAGFKNRPHTRARTRIIVLRMTARLKTNSVIRPHTRTRIIFIKNLIEIIDDVVVMIWAKTLRPLYPKLY
jgi:hypothetical protein